MKALIQISFCLSLLVPQLASADSAQQLLSECRSIANVDVSGEDIRFQQTYETGVCWGTFGAIQKVIFTATTRRPLYGVCAPPNSTLSQLVAIFVSYAEKNPQHLHEDGFDIALESLQVAFSCKGRKSATPNPSFEGTSLFPPIGGAPLNSALGVAKPNNCSNIMQIQEKELQYIIWQNRSVRFYVAARLLYLHEQFSAAAFCCSNQALESFVKEL